MTTEIAEQVGLLAGAFGCSLNGQPARLEQSKARTGRPTFRVIAQGGETACFNPSVVQLVMLRKGGQFRTIDLRKFASVI